MKPNQVCAWYANASGGTGGYTYLWKKGTTVIGPNSAELDYSSPSSFTITLIVTDAAGHSVTTNKAITVSSSAPICQV